MNIHPTDRFLLSRDVRAENHARALATACDNTKALMLLGAERQSWTLCEQRRAFRDLMLDSAAEDNSQQ